MTLDDASEKPFRSPEFQVDDAGETPEIAALLGADVATRFGERAERPLTISARDADGALLCGLNGASHWGWLYIRHFFVAPAVRGRGLGRALMAQAELAARARNCLGIYLDTFDEGAALFYERLGFTRCGRIENFPRGAARVFLSKALS